MTTIRRRPLPVKTEKSVNIIGCGKLGKTIGYLLANQAGCRIKGVLNTSLLSSLHSVDFIGQGRACNDFQELESANIWLIATPDEHIPTICKYLSTSNRLSPGTTLLHFSSALTSELFKPLHSKGCFYGSLHPLINFTEPTKNSFQNIYCVYEGDGEPYEMIKNLFNKMGATIYKLSKDKKPIYNIASEFASTYILNLLNISHDLFKNAGIEEDVGLAIIRSLATDSINTIKKTTKQNSSSFIRNSNSHIFDNHIATLEDNPFLKTIYMKFGMLILNSLRKNDISMPLIKKLLIRE